MTTPLPYWFLVACCVTGTTAIGLCTLAAAGEHAWIAVVVLWWSSLIGRAMAVRSCPRWAAAVEASSLVVVGLWIAAAVTVLIQSLASLAFLAVTGAHGSWDATPLASISVLAAAVWSHARLATECRRYQAEQGGIALCLQRFVQQCWLAMRPLPWNQRPMRVIDLLFVTALCALYFASWRVDAVLGVGLTLYAPFLVHSQLFLRDWSLLRAASESFIFSGFCLLGTCVTIPLVAVVIGISEWAAGHLGVQVRGWPPNPFTQRVIELGLPALAGINFVVWNVLLRARYVGEHLRGQVRPLASRAAETGTPAGTNSMEPAP